MGFGVDAPRAAIVFGTTECWGHNKAARRDVATLRRSNDLHGAALAMPFVLRAAALGRFRPGPRAKWPRAVTAIAFPAQRLPRRRADVIFL